MTRKIDHPDSSRIPPNFEGSDAVFSNCRKYRYALWRRWDLEGPLILFIGLNPSTADEVKNDPTIRRCIGFAKDWGFGGVLIANLFAFRSTSPTKMKDQLEPIGKENDRWIGLLAEGSEMVIAAWGNHGAFLNRFQQIQKRLPEMKCMGLTSQNQPRHPLYLRRDTIPQDYHWF